MAKKANEQVKKLDVTADVLDFSIIGEVVESRLKFKPRAVFNGLTQGYFLGAELTFNKAPETDANTGLPSQWEYRGLDIPNLKLTFKQAPASDDPYERWLELTISPFTNTKNDGTPIEKSSIGNHYTYEYKRLMHISNAFKTNANYEASPIPNPSPFLPPVERIANLTEYYTAWAKRLNGKDGKGFPTQLCWIKVVADSQNQTRLTLPDYVGEGFIEKVVEGRKPTIEIKPNETIELKASTKKGSKTSGGAASQASEEIPQDIMDVVNKYK